VQYKLACLFVVGTKTPHLHILVPPKMVSSEFWVPPGKKSNHFNFKDKVNNLPLTFPKSQIIMVPDT